MASSSSTSSAGLSRAAKVGIAVGAVAAVTAAAYYFLSADDGEVTSSPYAEEKDASTPHKPERSAAAAGAAAASSGSASAAVPRGAAGAGGADASTSAADLMPKQDLVNIFHEMCDRIVILQTRLREAVQAGKPMDLEKEHTEGLSAIEQELHTKYGVTAEQVTRADEAYAQDTEVQNAKLRLQSLFTPQADESRIPEGMTADKFLEKFMIQAELTKELFNDGFAHAKSLGVTGQEAMQAYMQYIFPKLPDIQKKSLDAAEMSEEAFSACLLKYQESDVRIQQVLMEMQALQERRKVELLGM